MNLFQKLFKLKRPVIPSRGQTEAVINEGLLSGAVPLVHPPDLRHGHMRLVDKQEKIIGEIIQQSRGRFTLFSKVQMARVVFNAVDVACLKHHFNIKICPLFQPLGFEKFLLAFKKFQPFPQLLSDVFDGDLDFVSGGDEVFGREQAVRFVGFFVSAGERVKFGNLFQIISEKIQAQNPILVRRHNFDDVSPHPESAAAQFHVISEVLQIHDPPQKFVALVILACVQFQT